MLECDSRHTNETFERDLRRTGKLFKTEKATQGWVMVKSSVKRC